MSGRGGIILSFYNSFGLFALLPVVIVLGVGNHQDNPDRQGCFGPSRDITENGEHYTVPATRPA